MPCETVLETTTLVDSVANLGMTIRACRHIIFMLEADATKISLFVLLCKMLDRCFYGLQSLVYWKTVQYKAVVTNSYVSPP